MVRKKGERRGRERGRGEEETGVGRKMLHTLYVLGDFANIASVFARLSKLVRRVLACVSKLL